MSNLWKIPIHAQGMAGVTRDLGYAIESALKEKGHKVDGLNVDINQQPLDGDTGFLLTWSYKSKHSGEIMISRSREGRGLRDTNALTIDRFWGIRPVLGIGEEQSSSPAELRAAAQIYDDITALFYDKFGNPISEHDGRSIYRTYLEQEVSTGT